ncbi:MAG TPA: sulfatase-like hydrolase/transferase, partial [Tepidisphaeraceae bacterium]|nr:sulfatase-like hydrolase/transferase [Tepidisphaeraceae bacterium]
MTPQLPNLLFIFTDEQRRDTLACYGNTNVQMPNLNRLAESACIFDDAYCVNPVCTPSRGCLMTGLYPLTHGAFANNIPLRAQARCLPELIAADRRRAYCVEYHGKWHLGDELYP